MEHSADMEYPGVFLSQSPNNGLQVCKCFFIPVQRKQTLSQGLTVYFPIDLGAGLTRDPLGNSSKLIKDVCLRFACFSCLIEKVAVWVFIVKEGESVTRADPRGGGWEGIAHFSTHVTSPFPPPLSEAPHRAASLSSGWEPELPLALQMPESLGVGAGEPGRETQRSCSSVRPVLFAQLEF